MIRRGLRSTIICVLLLLVGMNSVRRGRASMERWIETGDHVAAFAVKMPSSVVKAYGRLITQLDNGSRRILSDPPLSPTFSAVQTYERELLSCASVHAAAKAGCISELSTAIPPPHHTA